MSHRLDPPAGLDVVQLAELHDLAAVLFVFLVLPLLGVVAS